MAFVVLVARCSVHQLVEALLGHGFLFVVLHRGVDGRQLVRCRCRRSARARAAIVAAQTFDERVENFTVRRDVNILAQ